MFGEASLKIGGGEPIETIRSFPETEYLLRIMDKPYEQLMMKTYEHTGISLYPATLNKATTGVAGIPGTTANVEG